jgi:hypothetical protein
MGWHLNSSLRLLDQPPLDFGSRSTNASNCMGLRRSLRNTPQRVAPGLALTSSG